MLGVRDHIQGKEDIEKVEAHQEEKIEGRVITIIGEDALDLYLKIIDINATKGREVEAHHHLPRLLHQAQVQIVKEEVAQGQAKRVLNKSLKSLRMKCNQLGNDRASGTNEINFNKQNYVIQLHIIIKMRGSNWGKESGYNQQ